MESGCSTRAHRAIPQSEMHPVPDADHDILAYDGGAVGLRDWVARVLLKAAA
jgi:hypothetical protein